ncbi:MAG TPA: hypothetical protein ENJ18_04310 [Nannocystis exedens]|nr:hypothetical protein [Nannocystis exedens]
MTRQLPATPHSPQHCLLGLPAASCILLLALGTACPGGEGMTDTDTSGEVGCESALGEGALVITEVMPDPEGADDGREWFEVYNPGPEAQNLKGLVLAYSKVNGDSVKSHTIAVDLEIAPGQYMTFGDLLPEAVPDTIDYGYANDLGSMGNTSGRLQLVCDSELVDQIVYTDVKQGKSRSFTGAISPDATQNDDQKNWCLAPELFDPVTDEYGSPQAQNPPCPPPPPPEGQCWDDDVLRPIASPRPGDLVINEFHANPMVVDDADGEWLEITALKAVDLNGIHLGKQHPDLLQTLDAEDYPQCLPVAAGQHIVFARELDSSQNGGIPTIDYPLDFSLNNSNSGIFVADSAGELVDAITYQSTEDGAASSLDPAFATAAGNDDANAFCPAVDPYGEGDLGTPGGDNPACPQPPPEDQCLDNGEWRDIRTPVLGDLVITEVMPDPSASSDKEGEWLEIYANVDFDLNRLTLGKEPGTVLQTLGDDDPTCLPVAMGTHFILAVNADTAVNGGLPEPTYPLEFSLGNGGGPLFIALPGIDKDTPGESLDETSYVAAKPGFSRALDPAQQNPGANDDPANWCDAADSDIYGDGDHGTPAAPNSPCGGGGDGMCDDNGVPREPVAPAPGDLIFTEYMANPTKVPDGDGEWFEVRANADFDLNNLQLGKQPGNVEMTLIAAQCQSVKAGDLVLFAHSDDANVNGGLPQVDQLFGFSLVQSNGGLFAAHNDIVIAELNYTNTSSGAAASLDPNDVDWCLAVDAYGLGDLGTPGVANPACGMMPPDDQCLDGGDLRAIVPPQPGELVITELMANPAKVNDSAGEWFELIASSQSSFDLNGLKLAKLVDGLANAAPLTAEECLSVGDGDYILFARDADPMLNGGLQGVDYTFDFGLTNTSGGLAVGVADVVIDVTSYSSSKAGKSASLDPGSYDADLNDDAAMPPWCSAVDIYGDGDLGTPKAVNPLCG